MTGRSMRAIDICGRHEYLDRHPQSEEHGTKIQAGGNDPSLLKHLLGLRQGSHQEHCAAQDVAG